jgi:hypothetical protein
MLALFVDQYQKEKRWPLSPELYETESARIVTLHSTEKC